MDFINEIKDLIYYNLPIIIIVGIGFILDFITGTTKAIYKKNFKSNKFKRSVGKGLIYFCFVIMSVCIQYLFPIIIPIYKIFPFINRKIHFFIYIMCLYLIINDFISVEENSKLFSKGIPFIVKFLKKTKETIDNIDVEKGVDTDEN